VLSRCAAGRRTLRNDSAPFQNDYGGHRAAVFVCAEQGLLTRTNVLFPIPKKTGLPLKTEGKLKNGMDIVTAFNYSHVQDPTKYIK